MKRITISGVRSELLQSLRVSHAIAEAGVPISIAFRHISRWRWLDRYFPGLDWEASLSARRFRDVTVDHQKPLTRVGPVTRPLIFAQGIVDRCESMWADNRLHFMSFTGLMTSARQRSLERVIQHLGDDFHVVPTDAGRSWPRKAWDEEYYRGLGDSKFVACPDGDFVWTYRFFESALCGAIPVIENLCEPYIGFNYYRLEDVSKSMEWRPDWAIENVALARRLLTVPEEELSSAVYG